METDPLELAAWELVAGELRSENLPGLATDALVRGLDSPALSELAGQDPRDARTSADLFRATLDQLGIELPSYDQALWNLVMRTAREIVAGTTTPRAGANRIFRWASGVEKSGDLQIFVTLADAFDAFDDVLGEREQLSRQIVEEAAALLSRPRPRTWITLRAVDERSPLTRRYTCDAFRVDVTDLPIDARLGSDIDRWNAERDALMAGRPRLGGFASVADAQLFVAAGHELASRLQTQLGPDYCVDYLPELVQVPGVRLRGAP
jgi:hypothetical protein